jgi:nicotinamidase-related amidase
MVGRCRLKCPRPLFCSVGRAYGAASSICQNVQNMPLLDRSRSLLLVIDLQERLMPAIDQADEVLANAERLVSGAELLGVPVVITEQYPRGLGPTVPSLAGRGKVIEKMSFSAWGAPDFAESLNRGQIVVIGTEAHICVCQTVLDLLSHGYRVSVVADAVGSRRPHSRTTALERLARHGADVVTTEMALFEWTGTAADANFKQISALIK